MGTEREFDAIFYDLGGTLRLVERDAAFEAEARRKIAEMCGEKGDPDEFCKFLDYRYAGYRKWCFETMREAPEEELWTKWLTPEYDRDLIRRNAIELTIEYRNKDGRRVVAPNGAQSIKDLYANGRICTPMATSWASSPTWSPPRRSPAGWRRTIWASTSGRCSSPVWRASASPIPPSPTRPATSWA